MYREKLTYALTCPKHKSFTPVNGAGSIKGGCDTCFTLCEIFESARSLEAWVKNTKTRIEEGK
jgi:hypothetical protein